jgi:putative NADPH-quinone reductase
MGTEEWRAYRRLEPALDDQTGPYAAAVARADILAFVYPSVWFGLPAVLKGFLERVFVPGVAFHLDPAAGRVRPGLQRVRHLVGVTSHDTSRLRVTAQGDVGRRTILRTLRMSCGPRSRSTWLVRYGAAGAVPAGEVAFLGRIERALGGRRPAWTTPRLPRPALAAAGRGLPAWAGPRPADRSALL